MRNQPCIFDDNAQRLIALLPLHGLKVGDYGSLQIDVEALPCCDGTGLHPACSLGERRHESYLHRCSLHTRLAHLINLTHGAREITTQERGLATLLCGTWPPRRVHSLEERLTHARTALAQKDLVLESPRTPEDRNPLSDAWILAALATWRLGVRPWVLTLGRRQHSLLDAIVQRGDPAEWLLIDDVGRLWDPGRAFELETIIDAAYQGRFKMWIFLNAEVPKAATRHPAPSRAGGSRSPRDFFAEKIKSLHTRDPFSWLAAGARSRLSEMGRPSPVGRPERSPQL